MNPLPLYCFFISFPRKRKKTELFKVRFSVLLFIQVGLNGLEPSTSRLSGVRSNQLSYRPILEKLERVMGIEPTTTAWKAVVLPLNYTRIYEPYQ
jgi:hypothetical protein